MTPSSSSLSMICSNPWVTATEACRGFLPVANALGAGSGITYSLGTGKFASSQPLDDLVESRYFFPRHRLRPARPQGNLVREEVGERVHDNGEAQRHSHPGTPAEIAAQKEQQQREPGKQKSCAKDFHGCLTYPYIRPSAAKWSILLDSCRRRWLLCGHALEAHRIFRGVSIDAHVVAGQDRAFENLQRQRVLYQPLNRAAERPRAVGGIVPFTQEQLFGRVRHFYADAAFGQEFLDA